MVKNTRRRRGADAAKGRRERLGLGEIGDDGLDARAGQRRGLLPAPHQCTRGHPALRKQAEHLAADEPRGFGDEDHRGQAFADGVITRR